MACKDFAACHQSVSSKMHQFRMTVYNKFLCEFHKNSLSINKELDRNYQATAQKIEILCVSCSRYNETLK